ncbi:hypothetical protein [Noviherbaspirillum saxi]|uniref:Uncharacterized protein n=1 Tax=Noviherbaspirillum saxi TaxID=2320863 RepID=A0A3A3FUW8_9BURK|nr:hypothetical protein [Noviherbaspirillum saxi]RJF98348.1 hypothetical protein D3871_07340 [Noviherbaspirillum saxi]
MQKETPPSQDKNVPPKEVNVTEAAKTPASPYAGRPLDGSQYVDVIEEQEYADLPPTREEQQPRYSYLKNRPSKDKA